MKLENLVSLEVKLYGRIIASTRKDAPKLFIADSNGALAKTDCTGIGRNYAEQPYQLAEADYVM